MLGSFRQRFRNLADTLRFLPQAQRRRWWIFGICATASSTAGVYVSLQTFFLKKSINHLQMYKMKMPLPLNPELDQLFHSVIEDEMNRIKFNQSYPLYLFNFIGCDIYSMGNMALPTGAAIGVPFNYNMDRVQQLDPKDLRLLGRYRVKYSTDSPMIKKLCQSLILSNHAKRYIFAHQIHLVNSTYFFVKTFNIILATVGLVWAVPKFHLFLRSKKLPVFGRMIAISICAILTGFFGLFIDEILDHSYDIYMLKKVLKNNPDYSDGAREFYEKLLSRNQALFQLMGDLGKHFYTENGATKKLFGLLTISHHKHLHLTESLNK